MAFVLRANQMHLFFCSLSVNDFVVFSVKLRTQRTALRSPYEKKNDDELNMIFCVCTCNGCALIWFFALWMHVAHAHSRKQTSKHSQTQRHRHRVSVLSEFCDCSIIVFSLRSNSERRRRRLLTLDTRVLYDCCSIRWANSVKRISFCFFFARFRYRNTINLGG